MTGPTRDPLLFGASPEPGLVAVEHVRGAEADVARLYLRTAERTETLDEPLRCFIAADLKAIADCPVEFEARALKGSNPINLLAVFRSWSDCLAARDWLARTTGRAPSAPNAPYLFVNDPVHQHLTLTGRTLFGGMQFEDVRRLQVDIECYTSPGYEFCNAEREGDRIIAIALGDSTGWTQVISGAGHDERDMLREFVRLVRERDPDVIEGHNVFNFDLPYLAERAARWKVPLKLGRDGSVARRRPSRVSFGERTIAYDRFEITGRHVVDTLFMLQAYDVSHRSLSGYGLKEAALHFGLARPGRVYIEGSQISRVFEADPQRVMEYCKDDVAETRGLSDLLSRSAFVQTQMLPYSYQNVCVRGSATRIDALMVREYVRLGHALPIPGAARPFAGGYTDMFVQGVVRNVHHCDVRSLYPSLMLTRAIAPASDEAGVFLRLLKHLRDVRMDAKERMRRASTDAERQFHDALQTTFKILINSFYGYLGFSQARFADFDAAETVAADGRRLLQFMIDWLRRHGATPVEIDTDGIYFVPPEPAAGLPAFREAFAKALPEGIEVEFDGEYVSMYSYKMKNYALLDASGEIVIKGAALKSRGLEPFQRRFMEERLRLKLEGRDAEAPALKQRYEDAIRAREWPIAMLAKSEHLQDSPATYRAKLQKSSRSRSAAYELALASGRDYRAGDQVSYYVTGTKKSVSVHEASRLVSEWDPARRDENVPYYLAKLDALNAKFDDGGSDSGVQGELGLG
jgi:DNA polymerase elongation subunit (family B)